MAKRISSSKNSNQSTTTKGGYDILTVDDVMNELNIGKNAIYKLLNNKDIKAFRIGTNWKIPRKELEAYIDRQTNV